jgi:hypothetical protein
MTDDPQLDDDVRSGAPGRRGVDHDRERIREWVRDFVGERVRRLAWKWVAVWVATLAFSVLAWFRASAPAEDARAAAARADVAASAAQASARAARADAQRAQEIADEANARAAAAARQSRSQCRRTRLYGPDIARAYAKYRILSPAKVRAYRATIPRRC